MAVSKIIITKDLMDKVVEELTEYRAIGTVEGYKRAIETSKENYLLYVEYKAKVQEFESIGTVGELKALKEKNVAKKPIEKVLPYSEEFGFNSEWKCPTCGAYVGYFSEGMSEPEQMEYCNECGQHIAKDWTETGVAMNGE